jgi:hypothetical protein
MEDSQKYIELKREVDETPEWVERNPYIFVYEFKNGDRLTIQRDAKAIYAFSPHDVVHGNIEVSRACIIDIRGMAMDDSLDED